MMKFLKVTLALSFIVASTGLAENRDPIGEQAPYRVDTSRDRTSSMVNSGTMATRVVGPSESENVDGYNIELGYDIDVSWVGRQQGTEKVDIAAEYFTQDFLEELRRRGSYESPEFKIKHQGLATVTNLDGRTYVGCHKLLFYDIDAKKDSKLSKLFESLFRAEMFKQSPNSPSHGIVSDIEDLKILTHVKYGEPVLGAVKLDVSGTYKGMFLKLGGDYQPN
jgi:hypothetical protein